MWQTSNCILLLIYRPEKDERLSWPGWLTYSGRFTDIVQLERRTGKVRLSETDVLPLCHQPTNGMGRYREFGSEIFVGGHLHTARGLPN